jgi:hypothetical protein
MAKALVLGEVHDILRNMPADQLRYFYEMRQNKKNWEALLSFFKDQKQMKMDSIYRLRRPKTQDDMIKNAVEHEYYAGRIAADVVFLQIAENAGDELERREREAKK